MRVSFTRSKLPELRESAAVVVVFEKDGGEPSSRNMFLGLLPMLLLSILTWLPWASSCGGNRASLCIRVLVEASVQAEKRQERKREDLEPQTKQQDEGCGVKHCTSINCWHWHWPGWWYGRQQSQSKQTLPPAAEALLAWCFFFLYGPLVFGGFSDMNEAYMRIWILNGYCYLRYWTPSSTFRWRIMNQSVCWIPSLLRYLTSI